MRVFEGRVHFSASLPILVFFKNVYLMKLSIDPACSGGGGGGFTPCMNCKGKVKVSGLNGFGRLPPGITSG